MPEQEKTTLDQGVTPPVVSTKANVTVDDYTFEVDTDMIDDVDVLNTLDLIENGKKPKEIVTFLEYLIGKDGYDALKAHFVAKDGKLRISKLTDIYTAIFEKFNPKG